MFDCHAPLVDVCIPAEFQYYWEPRGGPLIRADADKVVRDGPVFIGVEASDAILAQPAANLSRRRIDRFTIYYDFSCETPTSCLLRIATVMPPHADAPWPERIGLRRYWVSSKDESSMDIALGKLRFCVAFDHCSAGPSISFAELRT